MKSVKCHILNILYQNVLPITRSILENQFHKNSIYFSDDQYNDIKDIINNSNDIDLLFNRLFKLIGDKQNE